MKTMIEGLMILAFLFVSSMVYAEDATITWDAPTTNEDGSPLTDLAGYEVYHGIASGAYVDVTILDISLYPGSTVTYIDKNLTEDTHFYAVIAFDDKDNKSIFSNEGQKKARYPPAGLTIMVK